MQSSNKRRSRLLLFCVSVLLAPGLAMADGGAIQTMQEVGGFSISVFTSPAILTEGEVDISVLVQDPESHLTLTGAKVQVITTPRAHSYLAEQHEATEELATNRLFKACHVQLAAGWHDVEVIVSDNQRRGRVAFAVLVGPAPTGAANFWPWFTWPAVPLVLVAANLAYGRFQSRRSAIIKHQSASFGHTFS